MLECPVLPLIIKDSFLLIVFRLKSPSSQLKNRQQRNSPATIEYEKRKKIEDLQFCYQLL